MPEMDPDLAELLRPLTDAEMAALQAELEAAMERLTKVLDRPEPSGYPIMPYDPVWNPRPGPLYR